MNWYKTSGQPAYKRKTYPNKASNKQVLAFYNWLKAQNIIIDFYHGTSDLAYSLIEKIGWMTPPTWRGRQKEEGRYDENIHGEEAGLDKLFFTKNFKIASSYAERDANTWNSNSEKILEIKRKLNIDPEIKATPEVIKITIPLHDLDEIKGNVYDTFIYNEFHTGDHIKNIMRSNDSNEKKLYKIYDIINSNHSGEFTIKGGLPISRKEGFTHINRVKVEDYIELLENNTIDLDDVPIWLIKKYPDIIEKYKEAYIIKLENNLNRNILFYNHLPQWVKDEYPERIGLYLEKYIKELESECEKHPEHYYEYIPQWVKDKYFEVIEEALITGWENKLKENIFAVYDLIPQWLRDKYSKKLSQYEKAYVAEWERGLKIMPSNYGYVPQWAKDKYPEIFEKYNPNRISNSHNWYKTASDELYMNAINSEDSSTLQKMVNEAARSSGYTISPVYHGTGESFTKFDTSLRNSDTARYGEGLLFFTDAKEIAKEYSNLGSGEYRKLNAERIQAEDELESLIARLFPSISIDTMMRGVGTSIANEMLDDGDITREEYDSYFTANDKLEQVTNKVYEVSKKPMSKRIMSLCLRINNPIDEKVEGGTFFGSWNHVLPRMVDEMKAGGNDGIIARGVYDSPFGTETRSTVYVVPSAFQVKSIDPVTYDDNGGVIPLSVRFDESKEDIRW